MDPVTAAAVYNGGTLLVSAVSGALQTGAGQSVVGNRVDAALVGGLGLAGGAVARLRENCARLNPTENHVLYRALMKAHWRAVQQTAAQHAAARGMTLADPPYAAPLPASLREALANWRSPAVGIFSAADQQHVRHLIHTLDDRVKQSESDTPLTVPDGWTAILDPLYGDLTTLVEQNRRPTLGPAQKAWDALAQEFPEAAQSDGFQSFFLDFWFDFFSVNFQILTQNQAVSTLLMSKLQIPHRKGSGKLAHRQPTREVSKALCRTQIFHLGSAGGTPRLTRIPNSAQETTFPVNWVHFGLYNHTKGAHYAYMKVGVFVSLFIFVCVPLFAQELNLKQYLQRLEAAPGFAVADKVEYLNGIGVTLSGQGVRELKAAGESSRTPKRSFSQRTSPSVATQGIGSSPERRSDRWNTQADGNSIRNWNSTTSRVGQHSRHSSNGVSGTSNRIGNFTFHHFDNGVNGSSNRIGQFEFHSFSNGVNGSSNRIGQFEYHNFNDGVSGTSNRIGNSVFHNFSDGTHCVSTKIGNQTNTNCSK